MDPRYIPTPKPGFVFFSHLQRDTEAECVRAVMESFPHIPPEAILITPIEERMKPHLCKFSGFVAFEFEPDVRTFSDRLQEKLARLSWLLGDGV